MSLVSQGMRMAESLLNGDLLSICLDMISMMALGETRNPLLGKATTSAHVIMPTYCIDSPFAVPFTTSSMRTPVNRHRSFHVKDSDHLTLANVLHHFRGGEFILELLSQAAEE